MVYAEHNKRLRDLVGHREVACSLHRCRCISTNAITSKHTGLFVMLLTRFYHESLPSLALESQAWQKQRERAGGEDRKRVRADEMS